ncbi:unnamed protein product, partial [Ixodes persulcatus]
GEREGDVHPSLEDIHHCVINLGTDEKSKINKDTRRQLLKYFPQMMAMVGRQTTEIEVLKAKLEERGKVFSYADALLGRVGEGTRTAPLPAAQPAAPQPGAMGPSITGRPKHTLLIYLRTQAANASNDIKVMLKKYFNPHSLGLTDVSLREIRDGIAVQSNTANDLELLCAAIEEHPSTKDVFVLRKPNKRNPQFRVSGVDPDILPAELLTTVNTQNEGLEILPQDFHHRTMFKEKSGNVTHIFEVTAEAYPTIKEKSRLRLGWTMCAVNENFYVPRCDKCCTYGHVRAKCSSKVVYCTICAGTHAATECQVVKYEEGKCRACISRRVNSNHPFGASECGTLSFHINRIRAQTDYPQ